MQGPRGNQGRAGTVSLFCWFKKLRVGCCHFVCRTAHRQQTATYLFPQRCAVGWLELKCSHSWSNTGPPNSEGAKKEANRAREERVERERGGGGGEENQVATAFEARSGSFSFGRDGTDRPTDRSHRTTNANNTMLQALHQTRISRAQPLNDAVMRKIDRSARRSHIAVRNFLTSCPCRCRPFQLARTKHAHQTANIASAAVCCPARKKQRRARERKCKRQRKRKRALPAPSDTK